MSLGQLSSRGKQNNKLYMVNISLTTNIDENTHYFFINFYAKQKIETTSELFNYLKDNRYSSTNRLPVNGSGYALDYRIYCVYNLYYNSDRINFRAIYYQNINGATTITSSNFSYVANVYTINWFEVI